MSAAEAYAARIDAVTAQQSRTRRAGTQGDRWSGPMARRFRADPRRPLDANLEVIAAYVRPDDVLIDVGGGAGRLSLPLASRCREVINVDPSPGMREQFDQSVAEGGVRNARSIASDWIAAADVQGDVVLVANVTFFVRDIVPFIEKLEDAARRRVIIPIASPPPPMMNSKLFRLVHGEDQEPVPGQPELLPVLWEMGIMPDVRVLPETFTGFVEPPASREEAITRALQAVEAQDEARARQKLEAHIADLFTETAEGLVPCWRPVMHQLVITWEPHAREKG
jgi:16S rRNA A1518/A1519 N6-dimethyltransferase RsmA/KsgA/DIM1 with predicted DNA glycosylase/AP lyase activity